VTRLRRLGSVATVVSGYAFKSSELEETGDIPVVKIRNIRHGYTDLSEASYVSKARLKLNEKYHIRSGDILMSLTGSHESQPNSVVGRVGLYQEGLPEALLNQRAGKVIPDHSLILPTYLYYVLLSSSTRKKIARLAHGAASQANVSPSQVEGIIIDVPPLDAQKTIGEALSAYDKLISTNTRRIKALNEIIDNYYLEWFVRFRQTGSEAAHLPAGWVFLNVKDIAESITRGISPTYADSGSWLVVNQRCIRNGYLNLEAARRHGGKVTARKILQTGDILINSTGVGTLGRVAQFNGPQQQLTTDSHVTIIRPGGNIYPYYLGAFFKMNQNTLEGLGRGTTGQLELDKQSLEDLKILVPANDIQEKFNSLARLASEETTRLLQMNKSLSDARDILLAHLINTNLQV
jgi:type I restriction enzyme, S subunit